MRPYAADDSARHGFVELVRSADVAFTQLDILLNDFRGPPAPGIGIHISTSPRSGQNLLSIGFNLFSTAGNHVLDFGVEGLRRHLEALRELGMSFAGVGETAADAAEPAVLELARGRVALVAAASSLGAGWPSADPSPGIEGRAYHWRSSIGSPFGSVISARLAVPSVTGPNVIATPFSCRYPTVSSMSSTSSAIMR
jgi:poly-gamma-glutamate capsule biosynthesis protein CapA/YwtB (metallophosphatase superfamily)